MEKKKKKNLIQLPSKYIILSIPGPHSGEDLGPIFDRKIQDIEKLQKTFWLMNSSKINFQNTQEFFQKAKSEKQEVYCLFIGASSKNGAKPTIIADSATKYSQDNINWKDFPTGLGVVNGNIKKSTTAFVFNDIKVIDPEDNQIVDLWQLSQFQDQNIPIQLSIGSSTILCITNNMEQSNHSKIKSRFRNLLAIATFADENIVLIKK